MPRKNVRAHADLPLLSPADEVWIQSFMFHLAAKDRSERTKNTYRLATALLARWARSTGRPDLAHLTKNGLEHYLIWMKDEARTRAGKPFAAGYPNNQFRALRALYVWLADDEGTANPMAKLTAPKVPLTEVPVISDEDMILLLKPLDKAPNFETRR